MNLRMNFPFLRTFRGKTTQRRTMTAEKALRTMEGRVVTVNSVDDRVEIIARNIQDGRTDPAVHTFASKALTERCGNRWCVPARDWQGEVAQVAAAIQDNVRYTLDTHNLDTYRTPRRTLQLAMGDCDDMAALGGAVLQAVGYPVMIKVIQLQGQPDFHHVYLVVGVPPSEPETWIAFDTTHENPVGYEPPGIEDSKIYEVT